MYLNELLPAAQAKAQGKPFKVLVPVRRTTTNTVSAIVIGDTDRSGLTLKSNVRPYMIDIFMAVEDCSASDWEIVDA